MRLLKLYLKNFMCYEETEVMFPESKLINIYGFDYDRNTANGAGKSAIGEALLFCLFGRSRTTLQNLIRKGKSFCAVGLVFEKDNDIYEINRRFDKSTTLRIVKNDKTIQFHRISQAQSYINDVLGMNYDSFVNFSIFDVLRFEDLSSLSLADFRKLLRTVFNFESFESTLNKLKIDIKSAEQSLSLIPTANHYYSTKRLYVLQKAIKSIKRYKDILDRRQRKLLRLIRAYESELSKYNTIIERNNNKIKWLMNKDTCPTCFKPLDNKVDILNRYQQEINDCQQKAQELSNKIATAQKLIDIIKEKYEKLSDKLFKLNKREYELTSAEKYHKSTESIKQKIDNLKVLYELTNKFEEYVISHTIQNLEALINSYLSYLTDISCKIIYEHSGKAGKILIKIYRNNSEFLFQQLSSGEKMLVSYAFKLAINTFDYKDTILFIDEGLSRLDKNNRNKLLTMLQQAPFNQIFLISHDDNFKDLPTIFIEKRNNVSNITTIL